MKASLLLLFYAISNTLLWCQINESFSKGSFSNDPLWQGDTADFFINDDFELQLLADSAGNSFIYAQCELHENTDWVIDINLMFDPSASNQLRIYLFLDNPDYAQSNGYYLELGETGSSDRLKFYLLSEGVPELLASSTKSYESNPDINIAVMLRASAWTITTRESGSASISDQLVVDHLDSGLPDKGYFGLYCLYTATRTDKFIFDNIWVDAVSSSDTTPPTLLDLEISSQKQLILHFSEALASSPAENTSNYLLMPGPVTPQHALLLTDPSMVQLDLQEPLTPGQNYQLIGSNIADTLGNTGTFNHEFTYLYQGELHPYDVLINEIFDDPNPTVGLPAAEYLELLVNASQLNLGDLTLRVGSKEVTLPNKMLKKGDLVILHDSTEKDKFVDVSGAQSVDKWSTLINSGNDLQLVGPAGQVIHTASYSDTWYRHSSKAQGGWSLELINPNDPCALAQNWRASENLLGGTPGFQNSVFDPNASLVEPGIVTVLPVDSTTIQVTLNKNYLLTTQPAHFLLSGNHEVISTKVIGPNQDKIELHIYPAMLRGEEYVLSLSMLSDCSNTPFSTDPITVVLPSTLQPGDLVISEILFNPKPGGADFIEFYNSSEKSFLLSDLIVGNQQSQDIERIKEAFIIQPKMFVVLTRDPIQLRMRYTVPHPLWVIETELPNFADASGNVTLFTSQGGEARIIDAFDYSADMHTKLLKDPEGVSLERIDLGAFSNDQSNWHSAAEAAGFATPTAVNSQVRSRDKSGSWQVDPRVFSPDGDGYDDFVLLNYLDVQPGTYVHIKIYDAAGRLVKYLANNQSLANQGFIQWDGSTDLGTRAAIGIYTMFIDLFDLTGRIDQFKVSCVLAARF